MLLAFGASRNVTYCTANMVDAFFSAALPKEVVQDVKRKDLWSAILEDDFVESRDSWDLNYP